MNADQKTEQLVLAKMATKKSLIDFLEVHIGDAVKIQVNVVEYAKPYEQRPKVFVNIHEMHAICQDLIHGHFKDWNKISTNDNANGYAYQYMVRGGVLQKNVARDLTIQVYKDNKGNIRVSFKGREGTAKSVGDNKGGVAIDQVKKEGYTIQNLTDVRKQMAYNLIGYYQAFASYNYNIAMQYGLKQQKLWNVNQWEANTPTNEGNYQNQSNHANYQTQQNYQNQQNQQGQGNYQNQNQNYQTG